MTFEEYQARAKTTARYPKGIIYPSLGLASEAGEVAGKVKKVLRDKGGIMDDEAREAIKDELGDVLWYIAQLGTELNLPLEEIAAANVLKLASRAARNTIQGDGDTR